MQAAASAANTGSDTGKLSDDATAHARKAAMDVAATASHHDAATDRVGKVRYLSKTPRRRSPDAGEAQAFGLSRLLEAHVYRHMIQQGK